MAGLTDPRRVARRRLLALRYQVPQALAGVVEGVHQARVASRRLREFLPLLASVPEHRPDVRRLRQQVRRLTRALGPVRELDVALLNLDEVAGRTPAQTTAVEVVRRTVIEARASAFARMTDAIAEMGLDALQEQVARVAADVAGPASRRMIARALAARVRERGTAVRFAVKAGGRVYAPDRLHQIRIALKKFRYALELAESCGGFRLAGTIGRLKHAQEVLGVLHDFEVLAARVRDCGADAGDPARQRELTKLARYLDEAVRQRHSEFLRARPTLDLSFAWARRVHAELRRRAGRIPGRPTAGEANGTPSSLEAGQ